ncbi:copper homeostasis protein CutC [Daejeonella lutea]|uniref:PF03932 family protein CutC n=1 Tax=Daejeonella lutea TaxID=572036 RepID=A0A1T5DS23_9SPHI|nr:copper homeostasis protein CutC [Daejeonella lutea]SKB74461.1 copper homeostasis protein [Daejeonella lutea]
MKYTLEICAGSLLSALNAQQGGADRVELCDNLYEGGTTPSYGMIKTCISLLDIPFFPIIRPRGGDFVYSDAEFDVMKEDILTCSLLGCEGVVFGILRQDGTIDSERCAELAAISGSMQLTFHRAFDRCIDRENGLESIIDMGFHRVLTSGGADQAEGAIPELGRLVKQAGSRISIMPGSGITHHNLLTMADMTGAFEFHSTAKKKIDLENKTPPKNLDTQYPYETDVSIVAKMRAILDAADPLR